MYPNRTEIAAELNKVDGSRSASTILEMIKDFENYKEEHSLVKAIEGIEPRRTYFIMYLGALDLLESETVELREYVDEKNPNFNWNLEEF